MKIALVLFVVSSTTLWGQNLYPLPHASIIHHSAYSLEYNEEQEQAHWVFYELTREELNGTYGRSDNFKSDPWVSTGSAGPKDYTYSGYDRGHLASAADMAFSETAMSESFYMSNMSPQDPSFNRGIWKQLEEQVRAWAYEDGNLYVVSGPLFLEGSGRLSSGVGVPSHFFKLLLDWDGDEYRSIAFLLPNAKGQGSLASYEVTIDRLEALSGLDFFPGVPDDVEGKIEAGRYGFWDYSLRYQAPERKAKSPTKQCQGTTQKGLQCKRRTTNTNGYCWQHQNQPSTPKVRSKSKSTEAVQCSARTQKGSRCRRRTKNSNGRCWQHQ